MTATTGELAGLAQLTHELAAATRIGNVMVRVVDAEGNAIAGRDRGIPTIEVGGDLVDTPALDGVIAHEVAHLALRHPDARVPKLLGRLSSVCLMAAGAAALLSLVGTAGGRTLWITLAIAAAVAGKALDLTAAWMERRQEYEADAYAVLLLNAADRPGLASTRAALAVAAEEESRWYQRAGWVLTTHPPAARRIQRLAPTP